MREIRRVQADGSASSTVAQFFGESRTVEELYDTTNDPHEINNLAEHPDYEGHLKRLRQAHLDWVLETRDLGLMPEAEINARQAKAGSAYAILRGEGTDELMANIREAASISLRGEGWLPEMDSLLSDKEPVVRYWAAIGVGNLGRKAVATEPALKRILSDSSENVRVAAARALCHMGKPEAALPVLVDVLDNGSQWARVHAANVRDEIDEQARPIVEAMKRNKAYRKGLVADGKYTVRVLNRALNELLGTNDVVK